MCMSPRVGGQFQEFWNAKAPDVWAVRSTTMCAKLVRSSGEQQHPSKAIQDKTASMQRSLGNYSMRKDKSEAQRHPSKAPPEVTTSLQCLWVGSHHPFGDVPEISRPIT